MMRVELVYRPGTDVYKSIHKVLEDVIAEERCANTGGNGGG